MKKSYSKDTPGIVRSGGKILVPYDISEYTDSEDAAGYQFYYFEIEDDGQDIADESVVADLTAQTNKYVGIEIDGVMCSATAEDQWGLGSIRAYIVAGNSTEFCFSNGNKLLLTADNISAFESVWTPFRQSFFTTEEVS